MARVTKQCSKCKIKKSLAEFYIRSKKTGKYRQDCKECFRGRVAKNRAMNVEVHRERDKQRERPYSLEAIQKRRRLAPHKIQAVYRLNNAIRGGHIARQARCEECGKAGKMHGHHDDYSKPLAVRWLCPPCHNAWHKRYGEAPNGR